jgi:hypothetical protein
MNYRIKCVHCVYDKFVVVVETIDEEIHEFEYTNKIDMLIMYDYVMSEIYLDKEMMKV